MTRYFQTGATGFVGRKTLETFLQNGFGATPIGRTKANVEIPHINLDLESHDYTELDSQIAITSNDILIHCAGHAHVAADTSSDLHEKINHQGTKAVCNLFENQTHAPKVVYISTVAGYGKQEGLDIDETEPLSPTDTYGKSKLAAENYIREWTTARGSNYLILRLPLVVGKNALGNLELMINALIRNKFLLVGEGHAKRSWIDVTDIGKFITDQLPLTGSYNLTSGNDSSYAAVADAIVRTTKSKYPKNIAPVFADIPGMAGDLMKRAGLNSPISSEKISKLKNTLTFSNKTVCSFTNWVAQSNLDVALEYEPTQTDETL